MKRFLFLLLCCTFHLAAQAQSPVRIEPAKFSLTDTITIYFNAAYGNKALRNYAGDVFLYAGVINSNSSNPTDWQYITPSTWNSFPQQSKLNRINANEYSIRIVPQSYFNIPANENASSLAMVFRNEDGSLVGKEGGEADIIMPLNSKMNWWNERVFYEIFVRSFQDSNGDGIGDFNGIISRIPYLKSLGIGAVWLMPMHPSPSYHGYDVTNYKGVSSDYGTMADFRALVDSLHANDIKIIIDFVPNHSSNQHPWFQRALNNDPFYRNFYRLSDTLPNQAPGPWGQQLWHRDSRSGKYYYGVFWSGMPDINFDFAPAKDSIFAAARYWVDDFGLDGLRCDAGQYLIERGNSVSNNDSTRGVWEDFKRTMFSYAPNAMTVGEIWMTQDVIRQYNDSFNKCFNFGFAGDILRYANREIGATALVNGMGLMNSFFPEQQSATFITNHDQNRIFDQLGSDYEKCRTAASVLLTHPGVPYLYYGEELAMAGTGIDEDKRRPMAWNTTARGGFTTGSPWRAFATNRLQANVATMQANEGSIWYLYQKLIALRNEYPALRKGGYRNLSGGALGGLYAFERTYGNQSFMVVINQSASAVAGNIVLGESFRGRTSVNLKDFVSGVVSSFPVISTSTNAFVSFSGLAPHSVSVFQVTNEPVSVVENLVDNKLKFYPNPAQESLQVVSDLAVKVDFYSIEGRMVKTAELPAGGGTLSLLGLSKGVYMIKMQTTFGVTFEKLVKE